MAHKLALVFAVVAILSVANAAEALTTSSPTTASFNVTPVAVVNSTDTVFYNKVYGGSVTFGAGADNTTNYMYGYVTPTVASSIYAYSVHRRKLNSTTQASLGDETLTGASCDTNSASVVPGGLGASAMACALTASSIQNIWLYSWTATTTTAKATQISAETGTTIKYGVESVFYDSGAMMWYVIYRQYDVAAMTNTLKVNIQAVNVSNGTNTVVYAAGGVTLVTGGASVTSNKIGTLTGALNNVTNATTASVVYIDGTGTDKILKLIPVTLSTGAAGSVVTLGTDATTAGVDAAAGPPAVAATASHSVVNTLAGLGCSYSTYLAGRYTVEINGADNTGAKTTTKKIWIHYNGSSTTTENYTLGTTSDVSGTITGTQYGSGYTIFQMTTATGTPSTSTLVQYINYFGNGSYNTSSTATSVGTYQGVKSLWLDANGALWVGAANYETGATGTVTQNLVSDAAVGKLFGQVYLFANTLSSVFAFVALMVAALFAF